MGEKSAVDKDGRTITINNYLDTTTQNPYQKYAVYDMSGDNIPELIIKTQRAFDIFMIKDNAVTVWHQGSNYAKPLNNMAILYERPGGAPEHTYYQYYKLGPNGEEIEKITFSIYSGTEVSSGVKYEETYYVNDEKATKDVYNSTANPILALSDDEIIWNDFSIQSLAETKAVGVISLGGYDGYNQYKEQIKSSNYLSEYTFLDELSKDKFVSASDGTETFAIIPADDVVLVCVYKLVYDQELNKSQSVDLLYSASNADPIVVKCNFSDIYSDVNIKIVQKDGTVTEFSPRVSMKDGKLEIVSESKDAVQDLTKY